MSFKTVFTQAQVEAGVSSIAEEINAYYHGTSSSLLIVPILNGGVFLYVDLVRKLKIKSEMGVVSTSLYPSVGEKRESLLFKFIDVDVLGKNVLLVDEICYTGRTLFEIKAHLLSQGATQVNTAVLVHQQRDDSLLVPDWAAINYSGTDWLFGQGMDLNGLYRGETDILAPDVG